jgi:hypothetical protein
MFLFLCGFPILSSKIGLHVVENKKRELEVSVHYLTRNEIVFEFNAIGAVNADCIVVIHSNEYSR